MLQGAYNPYDSSSMAASVSRSFNTSQATGAGGFGSKVKRKEFLPVSDAPGPGACKLSARRSNRFPVTHTACLPACGKAQGGKACGHHGDLCDALHAHGAR